MGRSFSHQVKFYIMGRGFWLVMQGCDYMMLGRGFTSQNLDSKIGDAFWLCLVLEGVCACVCAGAMMVISVFPEGAGPGGGLPVLLSLSLTGWGECVRLPSEL